MLGDKIKKLRKERHITQSELANAIGLSRSSIGMIESNKQGTGNDSLIKIADFFDVTVDYLLSEDDAENIEKKRKRLLSYNKRTRKY